MPTPIRVGILGANRALFMVKCRAAMAADLILTGIYDIRPNRAQQAAQQHHLERVYPSYEAMLADPQIDLIVIGTPDHLHGQQAIQALEAGKHVLSEIPAAYEIDQLQRLVQLEAQSGLKYAMGNEVRWFPYLEAAKQMAEDGFWGEIFYSEAGYLHNLRLEGWKETEPETNEPHWRFDPQQPQTTFLGGGPHAFDTIRWLVGETNWCDVIAYGAMPYVPPHPEPGHAVALLRNADGRTCKIETSYVLKRPYALYFNLFGSQGTFETSRTEPAGLFFSEKIPFMNSLEKLAVPYATRPGHGQAGHGSSEIHMVADLVQAIRQNRPATINAREAARSIAPAICALESIRTGERVTIPQF